MKLNNHHRDWACVVRGLAILIAMLAIGLGASAAEVKAAPFAYVAMFDLNNAGFVGVIDTATNKVVTTIPVGTIARGVAVSPNGSRVYVTTEGPDNNLKVIDAASNNIVATVTAGPFPSGLAISPDGKKAYVTIGDNTISEIDTATNKKAATIPVGIYPFAVAFTPDGKRAYVANADLGSANPSTVSVIDTALKKVVSTITVGVNPVGIAIAPDGKRAYVANNGSNSVSVIDTAANAVVANIPAGFTSAVAIAPDGKRVYVTINALVGGVAVIDTATNTVVATAASAGGFPDGVAITPDGKSAYVVNPDFSNNVAVIDTATNNPAATLSVAGLPLAVAIMPPPHGAPFLGFKAHLVTHLGRAQSTDAFALQSSFTLGSSASNGIKPDREPVTLQVGAFSVTIPSGSFRKTGSFRNQEGGLFTFFGVIDGVSLRALIKQTGTLRYAFLAAAEGANLKRTKNPVQVTLTIGDDSGTTSVKTASFPLASQSVLH